MARIGAPWLLLACTATSPAQAQLAASDVNEEAEDAFGVRIGAESIGLYSETNVRGFSLQDAGNYRIEGSYFVRSASPANAILTGSTTLVGIGALREDFPGPSGIVNFTLRRPTSGRNLHVETGTRAWSGPFTEINFDSGAPDSRLSLVRGLHLYPGQRYADGASGDFLCAGLAPTWRPDSRFSLTLMATRTWWSTEADCGFVAPADTLPAAPRPDIHRGQDWTDRRQDTALLGVSPRRGCPTAGGCRPPSSGPRRKPIAPTSISSPSRMRRAAPG